MTLSHSDLKGQAGAYVLGSLDPEERISFEAHLVYCQECAAEVRSLRTLATVLVQGLPHVTPPLALRQRVLDQLHGGSDARWPARPRSLARLWMPMAASLLVAAGAAAYAVRLQVRVTDLETRLELAIAQTSAAEGALIDTQRVSAELRSAMGVLAAPDLVRIDLTGQAPASGASARALWSRARGMVFTASNLPPLPAGRVYQVWVVTVPVPMSAGLFVPDATGAGLIYLMTPLDIPPPVAVAVTLEPAGGVPAPTGNPYLVGKPGAAS
jgi:anti-sigma-K factor RskA